MKKVFLILLLALFLPSAVWAEKPGAGFEEGEFLGLGCARLAGATRKFKTILKSQAPGPKPSFSAQYGEAREQALDVFLPEKEGGRAPVIVMVHGGAWCVGDKALARVTENKAARWRARGFVFVSVNYRMLPSGAEVAAQASDVATALAYVQQHATRWKADPEKIILMGHSAGAHLVSLLGADPLLAEEAGARAWLGTVSLDSAALDVPALMARPHPPFFDDAFGKDEKTWAALSPYHRLSSRSLPWLGVCSTRRGDACPQAHDFALKAEELGIRAGVLEQDLTHGAVNGDLGLQGAYTAAVEKFMASLDPAVAARLAP